MGVRRGRVYSGALRGSQKKSGAFTVDLRLQLAESTEAAIPGGATGEVLDFTRKNVGFLWKMLEFI